MTKHIQERFPRQFELLQASLQPTTLICLLMIAVLWLALNFVLIIERRSAIEVATHHGSNLVRLFEENTSATLRSLDNAILALRRRGNKDVSYANLKLEAERLGLADNTTARIAFAGTDGQATGLIAFDGVTASAYIGDRDYFQRHREAKNDELIISNPPPGRFSNDWWIVLSRRVSTSDGNFAGTLIGRIEANFIESFYKAIDVGAYGSVVLRDTEGRIMASAGTRIPANGRINSPKVLRDALAKAPSGYFWGGGNVDGVNRLVSYRVSPTLPIVMTVGLAEQDVFAGYARTRVTLVLSAISATLLLLLGAVVSTRHQLRITRGLVRRRIAEKNLEGAKKFLDIVIENLPMPLVVKDPKTLAFTLVNRAYETFLGMQRKDIIGKTLHEIYPPLAAEQVCAADREACGVEDRPFVGEFLLPTPSNGTRIVTSTRLAVRDDNHVANYLITVLEDITSRRESETRLVHLAHYDALTELPNRALLQERLEQGLARFGRGENLAVLCLDLDDFKAVNDTFGHQTGDALLKSVSQRLLKCVRDIDTVARCGGDEFVIVQTAIRDANDVSRLAQRITETISAPHTLDGIQVNIGFSIGIAVAPTDGQVADQLLKNADLALYRAKAEARGSFCFFEPEMDTRLRERHGIEMDLRNAIVESEFELYYQPLVNLEDNEVCGFEALLRWHHPERGMVSPAQFIPVAEETGLISRIGEWALRQACAEAMKWPENMSVAVNLSPAQFRGENLIQIVISALASSGLPGHRLELEITESAVMQNSERTKTLLNQLRALGVKIAMDDFGTGYSSLSYLESFPFDKIKIDRSFISNLSNGPGSLAILKAIVSLANSMGMTTLAEGVETQEQLEIVRREGCTAMQGYLFSAPRPASEISRFFEQPTRANVNAA